ncbi:hypothetical protein C8J57DRAFT_1709483 [Mycena rebaudengoi]|nr:hypothetical protein C8J57DRAFT_1709483 [Mycena rebaudengoi]
MFRLNIGRYSENVDRNRGGIAVGLAGPVPENCHSRPGGADSFHVETASSLLASTYMGPSLAGATVPKELSQRYGLASRPFGIPALNGVHLDTLQNANILDHVGAKCKKSDLRILKVHSADSPLVSRFLEEPVLTRALLELDAHTIGLVVLPEDDSAVDNVLLERLKAVLVPSGFLIRTTTSVSTATCHAELSRAGFDNTSTSGAIVYAQTSILPSVFPVNPVIDQNKVMMVPYAVGNEMSIKAPLKALDDTYDRPIWLVAPQGYGADGLQSFGRSLRREYPQWNIPLFASYSADERSFIIDHYLPQTGMDIARTHAISLHEDEVLVDVSIVSLSGTGVWAVIGTVASLGQASNAQFVGKPVLAIVTTAPSKVMTTTPAPTTPPAYPATPEGQSLEVRLPVLPEDLHRKAQSPLPLPQAPSYPRENLAFPMLDSSPIATIPRPLKALFCYVFAGLCSRPAHTPQADSHEACPPPNEAEEKESFARIYSRDPEPAFSVYLNGTVFYLVLCSRALLLVLSNWAVGRQLIHLAMYEGSFYALSSAHGGKTLYI